MKRDTHGLKALPLLEPTTLARCLLLLPATLMSCKPAPQTNTVVDKAQSPDGRSIALLVQRDIRAALTSDTFFLIVIPASQDVNEAINAGRIWDSAPLVATRADRVRLRWQSNDTLLAICDSRGLEAIDIVKKLDNVRSVGISYEGFPKHTASD